MHYTIHFKNKINKVNKTISANSYKEGSNFITFYLINHVDNDLEIDNRPKTEIPIGSFNSEQIDFISVSDSDYERIID